MKAILIKDTPRFVRRNEAEEYYRNIVEFMESLGVTVIEDECDYHTEPPKVDFYVAHSRGCEKEHYFEDDLIGSSNFIKFGVLDGIIHPEARHWIETGRTGIPPIEHFIFTADQKLAIENKVDELNQNVLEVIPHPRQSAFRRPGVR